MKSKIILKFIKNDVEVSVQADGGTTIEVLVGIAETIQLLTENTEATEKSIIDDINKILKVLNEEKEENQ